MSMKTESVLKAEPSVRPRPSRRRTAPRRRRKERAEMSEGPNLREPGLLIPCVLKWALFLLLFITLIGRIRGGRPSRTSFL